MPYECMSKLKTQEEFDSMMVSDFYLSHTDIAIVSLSNEYPNIF